MHAFETVILFLKSQDFWQPFSILFSLPIIFTLEKIWPARDSRWLAKGWISDLFHTYEPWLHGTVYGGYIALANQYLVYEPLSGWVQTLHPAIQFLLLFLVTELIFYVVHRMAHKSPILWAFHQVHHSSTQYYSLMTKRFHVLDEMLFAIPTISAIALLGAEAKVAMVMIVFRRFMDVYGHSNINAPKMLIFFLVTPHFHAWHHSRDEAALDKNFGRDMALFDYLLGTAYYPKDRIPLRFGYPDYTNNYLKQQWYPFAQLAKGFLERARTRKFR